MSAADFLRAVDKKHSLNSGAHPSDSVVPFEGAPQSASVDSEGYENLSFNGAQGSTASDNALPGHRPGSVPFSTRRNVHEDPADEFPAITVSSQSDVSSEQVPLSDAIPDRSAVALPVPLLSPANNSDLSTSVPSQVHPENIQEKGTAGSEPEQTEASVSAVLQRHHQRVSSLLGRRNQRKAALLQSAVVNHVSNQHDRETLSHRYISGEVSQQSPVNNKNDDNHPRDSLFVDVPLFSYHDNNQENISGGSSNNPGYQSDVIIGHGAMPETNSSEQDTHLSNQSSVEPSLIARNANNFQPDHQSPSHPSVITDGVTGSTRSQHNELSLFADEERLRQVLMQALRHDADLHGIPLEEW